MGRRLLATALLTLLLVAPAAAQPRTLWPGVSFDSTVQFTIRGPVVLNVITGPRPGGTTSLVPLLSNDALAGRETLTAIERRSAAEGVTAGVNADFFTLSTGIPSGILLRDGRLESPPSAWRASAGVLTDGTLEVRRVSYGGQWQGAGGRRPLARFNSAFEGGPIALYTDAWGPTTPTVPDSVAVTLFPFPLTVPSTDLSAPVVETGSGAAGVPIPPGGAVVVATGASAEALTAEAPVGQLLTAQVQLKPEWPNLVAAIGGGPEIVRNGRAIFRSGELFAPSQISPRVARSAVGQLADGRIVLVAVDGRRTGYSVGVTNFELAQALVRLGAVTAMAFDSGGSTTMAFDGTLLNHPSEPERAISTALAFRYAGVYVQPATAVVSPDGDGVGDRQILRYRLVRPSTVTVRLTAPDGTIAHEETTLKQPGRHDIPFPPTPGTTQSGATSGVADDPVQGRWTLSVSASDEIGQSSEMTQSFVVNSTVGFLATSPPKLFLPPSGRDLRIQWQQSRRARVVVTVETSKGEVVRTLARRTYQAGARAVIWNGLDRDGKPVKGGVVIVRVVARNALGTVELARSLRVQRIVGAPH